MSNGLNRSRDDLHGERLMAEVERLTDSALLGEGPCWHAEEKALVFHSG